jgi:hypothetical protein
VTELTAKQVHERILLVGATVGLAFSGTLPWWETDTRVYSGWRQIEGGNSGWMTGWERLIVVAGAVLMLTLVVATLCRPYVISKGFATAIGLLAGVFTVALFVLALAGETSATMDAHRGLIVSGILSGAVSALWMSHADDLWPRPGSDSKPSPSARSTGPRSSST